MTSTNSNLISVIIPAHNASRSLGACIESVLGQKHYDHTIEIIVVDDTSDDETSVLARRYPVTLLFCNAKNRSRARNIGVSAAQGDLIVFLDADTTLSVGWLSAVIRAMQPPTVGACQGQLVPKLSGRGSLLQRYQLKLHERQAHSRSTDPSFPVIATGACAYRRLALNHCGLFDEALGDCEDADLSFRLLQAGFVLAFTDTAVATTEVPSLVAGRYFRRVFEKGRGTFGLLSKWDGYFPQTRAKRVLGGYYPGLLNKRLWLLEILDHRRFEYLLYPLVRAFHIAGAAVECVLGQTERSPIGAALASGDRPLNFSAAGKLWRFAPGVRFALYPDFVRIFEMQSRTWRLVGGAGCLVIEALLLGQGSLEEVITGIADYYTLPAAEIRRDIESFFTALADSGLVQDGNIM